jgi:flagellar motor switch protein FliG
MSIELPPIQEPPALLARTPERLSGRRKAAVLIAALGAERAASVIQHLQEDEVESLSLEMAKLDAVGERTAESIMSELAALTDEQIAVSGGLDLTREVLEKALGSERAEELLGRLSSVTEMRPFEFLRRTSPDQISAFLRTESCQTAALVVANLHSSLAAQVLARLPETMRPEVALRIARMGEASAEIIHQVEEIVRQKLNAVVQQEYTTAGGVKALADILGHTDRSTERVVLDRLGSEDGELAEEVRRMLFVFEDIVKLDDRAIQQVLREADQKDLVLALRGVPEAVKQGVLSNMSERGAAMLVEELEIQQPQRKRDVDAAQGRIVAVVRRLEEAGTIVISRGDDGDDGESDVV